ncbi:MAG: hypothetical protein RL757_1748 [Bacteroidota bacterium]|jgi:uncharacterized membrane protein YidH (DUF202 family)
MKNWKFTLMGFILVILGGTSLALSMTGVKLSFLAFIDTSPLVGFITKIMMVVVGLVLAILGSTNWRDIDDPTMENYKKS